MSLPILVLVETDHGRKLVARLATIKDFPPFNVAYNGNAAWKMDERAQSLHKRREGDKS